MDLAISATANSAVVPLVTHNDAGFKLIDDLVDVPITRTSTGRAPSAQSRSTPESTGEPARIELLPRNDD